MSGVRVDIRGRCEWGSLEFCPLILSYFVKSLPITSDSFTFLLCFNAINVGHSLLYYRLYYDPALS